MAEEHAEEGLNIDLLARGYFTFPMKDKGLKLELITSVDVDISESDLKKTMDKPEVLLQPFKDKKAGWAEFTAIYFLLPNIMLKAIEGMKEQYDYVVPIMATLGVEDNTVRVSFDCFKTC